jgi:hypothetical protein
LNQFREMVTPHGAFSWQERPEVISTIGMHSHKPEADGKNHNVGNGLASCIPTHARHMQHQSRNVLAIAARAVYGVLLSFSFSRTFWQHAMSKDEHPETT